MIEKKELLQYARLHISTQKFKVADINGVLSDIEEDIWHWDSRWYEEAERCIKGRAIGEAIQCLNFSRFPYAESIIQKNALERLHNLFQLYNRKVINTETVFSSGKEIKFYTSNLSVKRPTLFVIGGIVSIKEEWHIFLDRAKMLGFSVVVAEFPLVGENETIYDGESYKLIDVILESLRGRIDLNNIYIVAMSFGGTLALKAATENHNIKGISTVAAPVFRFFVGHWDKIPYITKETLSHVCDKEMGTLQEYLCTLALNPEELEYIMVPVTYVLSNQDEIVPYTEKNIIQEHLKNLHLYEFNDVHGAANNLGIVNKIVLYSILRQSNKKPLLRHLLRIIICLQMK